jgi:hypothetical protein
MNPVHTLNRNKYNALQYVTPLEGGITVRTWRGLRRLHNQELHNLYGSRSIMRVIKLRKMDVVWNVTRMGEMRNYTKFWWGKPKGNRRFGRHRRRWEDNIRMDLRGIGWEGVEWI